MKRTLIILFGIVLTLQTFSQNCDSKDDLIGSIIQQINSRNYDWFKTQLNRKIIENHTINAAREDESVTYEEVNNKMKSLSNEDFYNSIIRGFKESNNSISETTGKGNWKIKKYKIKKSNYIPSSEDVFAFEIKFKIKKNYFYLDLQLVEVESCFYFLNYPGLVEISNK